ncbi:unnamed protein product [Blepharisma stoltei]|uniref:Alcohol dehydrogenase N-terminal domain-containing protein n=1 Tax=Blepharisma stoltei TaxID=1481888 RepID=A0AAU9K055_9CILI|nr:unnamed protein product [Blepharisma stoltei]
MKAITLDKEEGKLSLKLQDVQIPILKPGQVLIKVEYSPIHSLDLNYIENALNCQTCTPKILGREGSGVVVRSHPLSKSWRLEGKRVSFIKLDENEGTWAEYVVCNSKDCIILNNDLSFISGSSMMYNPLAVLMVTEQIKKHNHTCIIQANSFSVLGKMMINWSRFIDVICINIVDSDAEKKILKKYKADYIVNKNKDNFSTKLRKICKSLHPTCVLQYENEEVDNEIFDALEIGGEMVIVGDSPRGKINGIPADNMIINQKKIRGISTKIWYGELNRQERRSCFKILENFRLILRTDLSEIFSASQLEIAINSFKSYGKGEASLFSFKGLSAQVSESTYEDSEDSEYEEDDDFLFSLEKLIRLYRLKLSPDKLVPRESFHIKNNSDYI